MNCCQKTAVMASLTLRSTLTHGLLVNTDACLEDNFYVKHTKEIKGCAVIRKQAVEMIIEATANGWEKEEIQHHLWNAWKCIFKEECLGLDGRQWSLRRAGYK